MEGPCWWEIEGKGRWPEEGKIEEFVRDRVRDGEGWAIAYALLCVAGAIRRYRMMEVGDD
jgi:hypothetical protein